MSGKPKPREVEWEKRNWSGRNGKPISLHPMSTEEALKKAIHADPKKVPKLNGK